MGSPKRPVGQPTRLGVIPQFPGCDIHVGLTQVSFTRSPREDQCYRKAMGCQKCMSPAPLGARRLAQTEVAPSLESRGERRILLAECLHVMRTPAACRTPLAHTQRCSWLRVSQHLRESTNIPVFAKKQHLLINILNSLEILKF